MKFQIFFFLFTVLLLTGCGKNVKVEGRVIFPDGSPLDGGRVVFGNEQFYYYGNLRKNGTFSIGVLKDGEGIPPGKYKVSIENAFHIEKSPNGQERQIPLVADKYVMSRTSGLEYDIQKKTTDISIVVEKPVPKSQ